MPVTQESDLPYDSPYRISKRLRALCQPSKTVSSALAEDPSLAPSEAWRKLFAHHECERHSKGEFREIGKDSLHPNDLERAKDCGRWGPQEPSDLFLRIYHDALCTLEDDLACGMVSPSLMGTSGTMPLTIMSVIPDIVRHMSNLIVRAEKEVFLATNFWQNGVASKYITNAIRELSRRAGERGVKIVIKIIYDRGSPKQLFEPHCQVPETEYTGAAVGLPSSHDIPNVDLQVINYHRALLGTFHAKYMIVDRSIAVLQSNNIQDNDNLEMMVQLEGPVVDSMYDMALLSWHKQFEPPLPKLDSPAAGNVSGSVSFDESHASIFSPEGAINGYTAIVDGNKIPKGRAYGLEALWGGQLKRWSSQDSKSNASDIGSSGNSKPPVSNDIVTNGNGNGNGNEDDHSERDLETMTHTLPEHTTEDPHYDDTLAGEVQRVQASLIPKPGETSVQAVSRHLNHTVNKGFEGNAPPCDPRDEMTPYVPHPAHEPFPMALVCRAPYGTPNHASVANPQNAAWLSAMRNARESVFIQTPTLNAEPLIPAILEACERGVDVYCYVCLGYNDSGEMLPFQGGHNEAIASHLHASLTKPARPHLHWHWYTSKDQSEPLPAIKKLRSCHIKLLVADARVAVVGNGNQDTQSWFHSQEANVLLDLPPAVCRAWVDALLRRNQNTQSYGAVGPDDGVWRDALGEEVQGATGVDPGHFGWAKGFLGAVKRVQGTGGF